MLDAGCMFDLHLLIFGMTINPKANFFVFSLSTGFLFFYKKEKV